MTEKVFVDTNVLVYAYDRGSGVKHHVADKVLRYLWHSRAGVVSPQVLQEFYFTTTRKTSIPLSREDARRIASRYAPWCVDVSAAEVLAAFRIEDEAKISFWDALIVASASRAGAVRLLTEDLNPGQTIAGVRIENPFARL